MCEVLPAQGLWGPFLYFFVLFCGAVGAVPALAGQRQQLRGGHLLSASSLKGPVASLPPAWGPRSPRCFTTPASRPGGFLWATLPHWAPPGRVWGLAGRCGSPSQGAPGPGRDASHPQLGREGSGRDRVHRGGPGEGREKSRWSTGEWG